MAKKVQYTQPLLGEVNAAGYLILVPGAVVQILQDGVPVTVYSDEDGTEIDTPNLPSGVASGTAGVSTRGELAVWLTPGSGYSGVSTVGQQATTFPIGTISPHPDDVQGTIPPGTYAVPADVTAEAVARVAADAAKVGLAGDETITGLKTVARPASTTGPEYGQHWHFGGNRRVSVAEQDPGDQAPHSGMLILTDGDGATQHIISTYQYGGLWRGIGPKGGIVEMWLGNDPTAAAPNLSIRHNVPFPGEGKGAIIQARDKNDYAGVMLDFQSQTRPRVAVELSASLPAGNVLAIEQPNATGKIVFATNSGSGLTDRVQITNAGLLGVGPSNPNQLIGVSGPGAGVSLQDTTATTGRSWELLSGGAGAGIFSIYDRTANSHRLSIDTSGNINQPVGSFSVAGGEVYARNGAATQVKIGYNAGSPSIVFGSAGDTNLYRSAADTLKTDDALSVVGSFGANGSAPVGKQTLGAAATDAASTQTLANNIRSALIAIGLGQT